MKKILSVLCVIAILAGVLAACRDTSPDDPTVPNTTLSQPTSASTTLPTVPTTTQTGATTTVPTVPSVGPSSGVTTKPTSKPTGSTTTVPSVPVTPTVTTTTPALQLPYQIPGTGLVVEEVRSYDGLYVEDGTNSEITGVAMILLRNFGKKDIEYATITISYGQFIREFVVTALPASMSAVVQEKNRNPMASGMLLECTASVIESKRVAQLSEHDLAITENDDNSITIENISGKDLPSVRLFYKYFMEDTQLLVGGITFTVNVTDLKAGQSVTVKPSHYLKGNSQIVMAQTYEVTV